MIKLTKVDLKKGFRIDIKGYVRDKNSRPCISAICPICNQKFWAAKRYRKTNPANQQIFCSRRCFFLSPDYKPPHAKGERSWNWKGGLVNSRGYLMYSCGKNKGKGIHTVIAEQVLGRQLKRNEQVHHINGNKSDNRYHNFIICSSSYHSWLEHKLAFLYKQEHFGQKQGDSY